MKNILILFVSLLSLTSLQAQDSASESNLINDFYKNSKQKIESKNYTFSGLVVYDKNRKRGMLSKGDNLVEVKQNSVSVNLQYLESNDKFLKFEGSISEYVVFFDDKKESISISFKANNYNFDINIKKTGNTHLDVYNDNEFIYQVGSLE